MLYAYAATGLVALACGLYGGWTARGWKADADLADIAETTRLRERAALAVVRSVDTKDAKRTVVLGTMAAADRAELERLRDAARRYRPDPAPSCAPVEQRFAECRAALAEGAGLATEGAGLVRDLERKHSGLAEYAQGLSATGSPQPDP